MKKIYTLCVPYKNQQVLLGMKKRGFGAGRWNGFGGKVKEGETIEVAAQREMQEESGIVVGALEKVGIMDFEFEGNPETLEVHIFCVKDFSGEMVESDEMKPEWFNINKIPFESMWPADKLWFPIFLEGKKFKGHVLFKDINIVLESQIVEVSTI
ncbi:MAG: 8-oxo-dGTP diphosphatase [bacterium]|nr:8-oxo-dGTP diphosphatase [bacterium]